MKITCPACSAEYNVDPSRIPAAGLKMRCPKCSQSFRVTSDGETESDQAGSATILDGGGHAIKDDKYYVRRHTGKVFGPFDQNAIQLMLKSNKLDGASEISRDKEQWKPIMEIPAFAGAVGENPKKTMMGMGAVGGGPDLPMSKADADLPAAKSGGGPVDLPARKQGGPTDLPAPKQGGGPPDLPAPKQSNGASAGLPVPKSSSADLPAAKGADLPTTRSEAELPAAKGGTLRGQGSGLPRLKGDFEGREELPTPRIDDLPGTKSGDLPIQKGADRNLPTSRERGSDLAVPRGEADLPTTRADGGTKLPVARGSDLPGARDGQLPMSREAAELPAGRDDGSEGLPVPKPSFEEDLFGDAEREDDDLFGGDDDDLFGDPLGDEDDDLFGPPDAGAPADDDLFGSPDDDDLFGSASEGDDDLFGHPSEAEDDDLFAKSADAGGDDFLGGDAGFSFLDDEPVAAEDDWGDDLFEDSAGDEAIGVESSAGVDDWGDDLLERSEPAPSPRPEPLLDSDDPFRPASRGLSAESEAEAPSADVPKEATVDSDRKRGGAMMLAVPILAVVIVAGAGYLVYTNFFAGEETVARTTTSVGPEGLDVSMLKSDNYSDYAILLDSASEPKAGEEGKWLAAQSMMLTRYPNEQAVENATAVAKKLEGADSGWEALGRGAWEARRGNAEAARAYLEALSGESGETGFFANLFAGIGDVQAVEAEVDAAGGPPKQAPRQRAPTEPAKEPTEEPTKESVVEDDVDDPEVGDDDFEMAEGEEADDVADGDDDVEEAPAPEPPPEPEVRTASYSALVSRARTALEAAQKIDPESPLPHYWKGRLAQSIGEAKTARSELTTAVEKGPGHVASHVRLGEVDYDVGNLNAAIENLEKVAGELAANASNGEKARALHFAGLVHAARRQSEYAIESFTKALSIDSSRSDTLRALAEEYERAQKYKEALNFFTTNKNLGQDDPEVMLGIVRSHIGLEQWNQAIAGLEAGQRQFPDDARFPYYLGQLFMKRGAFADARKPLERAVEIDPSLLVAHATLAQLSWRMDRDIDSGEEYIARIVEHADQIDADIATQVAEYYNLSGRRQTAEEWYREALDRDPNHWQARLSLSKLLLEENRQGEAQELLERARKEGVQDVRLSAYLADAYRQAGDYDRAIDEINKVIEAFPKNEEYIFIRGRIHFDRGNYDTAQEDFQKAYDLNPRYHDAYFFVGRTAFARDDFATALKIFRHVLDYKPDRGEYRYFMARTLEAANRRTQALDEYRKATAVDPAYGIENPMVYVYRGRLLSKLKYAKEGKADIARALELAPDSIEALLAMGESEYLDKNYEEAIKHYTKALQLEPASPTAQYRLGMSLLYTDRQNDAAQRLQLAIKHGYGDPEVYKRLGYLYRDLGQRSQALDAFKKFLKAAQRDGNVPAATKREVLHQIERLQ